ncbi:SpoIIE family protein phosphatase, partial [candidate division GN15 bacterium]|nr:SpoIIE family protein phosphatase [candidate division GN15 bacterium]
MPNISDRELRRLRSSLEELATLNQVANAINLSMSVEDITQVIIDTCVRKTNASQGAVFLLPPESEDTNQMRTFVRQSTDSHSGLPFHLTESLIGWMLKNRTILTVNDTNNTQPGDPAGLKSAGIDSLLSAPLLSRSRIIGAITVVNKPAAGGFDESDKRFLGIVGASTAKVIENAQLFEKEQQLTLLEKEMRTAAKIQRGLLPAQAIETEQYSVVGYNRPARTVGGDFFDSYLMPDGRVFVVLGDIAGKGVPAALLAAKAQASLRALLTHSPDLPLTELLATTNDLFCRYTEPGEYLTALVGMYDPVTGTLNWANCGHCPPFLLRADGGVSEISGGNLIIGALENVAFTTQTLTLEPGDQTVVFTDGVSDCANK